jgi:hypothetical protein
MEKWLEDNNQLSEAMELVPLMEAFTKAVKAAVKEKLKEGTEIPGYKLRGSGSMTTYEATKVAELLMDSNLITWNELMKSMKFSIETLVPVWADKTEQSKHDARVDLKGRLSDVAQSKPKASSVAKIK